MHYFSRKWREEKAALLEKLDSEEKSEIQEWREQAKKELSDWYERRDEQLGKTQTSNRYVNASVVSEIGFKGLKGELFPKKGQ